MGARSDDCGMDLAGIEGELADGKDDEAEESCWADIKFDLKPYGAELWLDTIDYGSKLMPVGQFHWDIDGWDVETGWECFMPMNHKAETLFSALRKHWRSDEKLRKL